MFKYCHIIFKLKKMKTGIAYAFLNYEGREAELLERMEKAKKRANFQDSLSFTVLDDSISTLYDHSERKELPQSIAELAKKRDVYGSAPTTHLAHVSDIAPTRATDLRYLVMAQAPDVTTSESSEPLGKTRANQETASMLNEVLSIIGCAECHAGRRKFSRQAVFYQDSQGQARRY